LSSRERVPPQSGSGASWSGCRRNEFDNEVAVAHCIDAVSTIPSNCSLSATICRRSGRSTANAAAPRGIIQTFAAVLQAFKIAFEHEDVRQQMMGKHTGCARAVCDIRHENTEIFSACRENTLQIDNQLLIPDRAAEKSRSSERSDRCAPAV